MEPAGSGCQAEKVRKDGVREGGATWGMFVGSLNPYVCIDVSTIIISTRYVCIDIST